MHQFMTDFTTLGQLIGNGKHYQVPRYQRDYAWDENEWEDLWFDILDLPEEKNHYMGYIVLQSVNDSNKNFTIIDGQQRFSTLSILYLAGIKVLDDWIVDNIDAENNIKRKQKLTERFISNEPAASLVPVSKLSLNLNNDDFYQNYLIRFRKPISVGRLKPSEKKLFKAYEYYYEKIKIKFDDIKSGSDLAGFLEEVIAENIYFTVIQVDNTLNAYKVFETLNARGVKLSTSDLLKNYLFSIADKEGISAIRQAERQWQNINDKLSDIDFSTFLRHLWNSRYSLERKQTLFKAIRRSISRPIEVLNLLDEMENSADIYFALSNSEDAIWTKEQRNGIAELNLLNVTQCYPLLLVSYQCLDTDEFTKLLKGIVVISFRYLTISGLNPNEMESAYNKVCIKIFKKELTKANQIFALLSTIYVKDETFRHGFSQKVVQSNSSRNKKLIRYILFAIENQIAETDYNFDDTTATIEHILPENSISEWTEFFNGNEQEEYMYRLGNYTLLEAKKNKDIGNGLFNEKYEVYQSSKYKLTSDKIQAEEWNPTKLRKRQENMAKTAATVWKINF
jgi:uncharacterized protein with ParB-like and HNH nuclease domain